LRLGNGGEGGGKRTVDWMMRWKKKKRRGEMKPTVQKE
jgi:hypothetical protein